MLAVQSPLGRYITVTLSYWAFTLTDGALRMLVVLYFHQLGYTPLEIATLFILYELLGMVTNLCGGWLAARFGLAITLHAGLLVQIVALGLLSVDASLLSMAYVMLAQAFSGIAKDLNKMSAKSSIKALVPENAQGRLYHWVAILTGSKNTLKGVGFFLGGVLLAVLGFQGAVVSMAVALMLVLLCSTVLLKGWKASADFKPKFKHLFSGNSAINNLSAARFFLFGARDVWFVVALPVFLQTQLGWSYTQVGTLLAVWLIGYGVIQGLAPRFTGVQNGVVPNGGTVKSWALMLGLIPAFIALLMGIMADNGGLLVAGILLFGGLFAVNSSVHSYLIVAYARRDGTSLDVGFYYMANAGGRLVGTVLSGAVYQWWGLSACLWISSLMIVISAWVASRLP